MMITKEWAELYRKILDMVFVRCFEKTVQEIKDIHFNILLSCFKYNTVKYLFRDRYGSFPISDYCQRFIFTNNAYLIEKFGYVMDYKTLSNAIVSIHENTILSEEYSILNMIF